MRRILVSKFSLMAAAYGASAVANALISVTVGRSLGAAALGHLAVSLSVARIFYAVTDMGVPAHLTRTVTRQRSRAQEMLSLFLGYRAALIPLAIVVGATAAILVSPAELPTFCLIGTAIGVVYLQVVYEALFLAHERQRTASMLTTSSALCVLAACGAWSLVGGTLVSFALVYVVATLVSLGIWAYWAATRLQVQCKPVVTTSALRAELRQSWPIGASVFLTIATLRSPVLILGAFGSSRDVGAFVAVDLFVTAATIFQAAVSNTMFSRLSGTFGKSPAEFRRAFWMSNAAVALIGLAVALFLFLVGDITIRWVFPGSEFERVTVLIPIMAWSTPITMLVLHNILVFASADQERVNVCVMTAWFVFTTALLFALVPPYGVTGAAWGVLLGRLLGLVVLASAIGATSLHRGGAKT